MILSVSGFGVLAGLLFKYRNEADDADLTDSDTDPQLNEASLYWNYVSRATESQSHSQSSHPVLPMQSDTEPELELADYWSYVGRQVNQSPVAPDGSLNNVGSYEAVTTDEDEVVGV
jgi:hypothetical protein